MGRYFTFTRGTLAHVAFACGVILAAPLRAEEVASQPPLSPTRHELWVPTKHLKEVLKKHPNAVVLDREQYEALIRDAGKVGPLKDQAAPVDAVIEEVKVTARVPADVSMATLTYEFHIQNLKDGWSAVTLPFALGAMTGSQTPAMPVPMTSQSMLTDMSAEKPIMVSSDENAWMTSVLSQGKGRHVLRLVFATPVSARDGTLGIYGPRPTAFSSKEGPDGSLRPTGVVSSVPVRLELPAGWKPAATNPATRLEGGAWYVASSIHMRTMATGGKSRSFCLLGLEWEPVESVARGAETITQSQVSALYGISGDRVVVAATLGWSGSQARNSETLRISLPKEARVLRASPLGFAMEATAWKPVDGGIEFQSSSLARSTGKVVVEFEVPWGVASGTVSPLTLPVARIEGAVITKWDTAIMAEPDIGVRLTKLLPSARPLKEFDKQSFRSLAQMATKGVGVDALIQGGQSGDLFTHPRFLGAFSFDAPPDQPVVEVQAVPDRFSVDADALVEVTSHEVGLVRTLVFHGEAGSTSRAVITLPATEVFLEVPVTSGEPVLWKQVGRDIEVTWPKGLAKGGQTTITVRTRRDIPPQAADGTATEKVAITSIPVSGASRVSGYAALKFDESWKVNVTDTTGLENRDARATPVRGRMAWFGLKEWKLGFDLSRRAPVHDATITAYALPRAKQVEIEGQMSLSVSGAPLRKFQVKLPVAIAPLLRVTSPLVGEQSLDAATGIWTLSMGRELIGTANVRFRMSLPAENTAEASGEGTLTAALPDITLPGARRTAGRWVVEANTDTELAFTTRGVQPLASRRAPTVEGYRPQHRIIAAYSHGGGEHEIRLTATRHDAASLAGMVLIHLRMTSVLGEDGSARHEAVFTLRHNGRQFATVRLPEGAEPLSTMVNEKLVKPVKAGANEVRLPLSFLIGESAPVEVKVIYDTPSGAWGGSGAMALTPPSLGDEVPVMETEWKLHTPAGFTLRHEGSGLVEVPATALRMRTGGWWRMLFGSLLPWENAPSEVDFLPGGEEAQEQMLAEQQEAAKAAVVDKMNRIILPTVQFNGASVEEAIEFLRINSRDYDRTESVPARKGLNMIIKPGPYPSTATISLDLKDVPLSEALRYVTELGGMKYKVEPHAVMILPISDVGSEMYVRKFKLSLAHLLAITDEAKGVSGSGSAVPDPFAPAGGVTREEKAGSDSALLQALRAQGIPFPEGSEARYDRSSQMLVVRNTQPSLDLVESYVGQFKPGKDVLDYYESIDELQNLPAERLVQARSPGAYYVDKMEKIIFPSVSFSGASFEEAIEFLRIKSKDYDNVERDPAKKGVNLVMKPGTSSTAKISLDLKDVPMNEALRYVTELGGAKFKVEPFAVVVVPISEVSSEMYTRTFKVPPNFLDGDTDGPTPADPFAPNHAAGVAPRSTALNVLSGNGIPYPEGAAATYVPATSQLIVRNTPERLALVEEYVNQLTAKFIEKRRNALLSRAKSGLVPLELELPVHGQVLTLKGHQRPQALTLKYLSWERQAARTSLLLLLGIALFWTLGRDRLWLTTFVVVLLFTCIPVLLLPSWSVTCHALLTGWSLALGLWLLWKTVCWWKRRTEVTRTVSGEEVMA